VSGTKIKHYISVNSLGIAILG